MKLQRTIWGFTFILASIIGNQFAWCQRIPEDIPFFQLEDKVADLKQTCVEIKVPPINSNSTKWAFGTGFLVVRPKILFVVTCNHCTMTADSVERDTVIVSLNIEGGKREDVMGVVFARSRGKDAAVLAIKDPKGKPTVKMFGLSRFDTADTKNTELRDGAGVVIIGFPLNIGSQEAGKASLLPVTRIGIVAYHSPNNIDFLIDGFANPGNSGSPVISARSGNLLGMVKAYKDDTIKVTGEKGKIEDRLIPTNSGLTVALTAKQIADLIKLAEEGL